jgi:nucleoside-diphosphate-sugar epimerase
MIDGSLKELSNSCKSLVDVRDVAEAHVAALEREAAVGKRFMLVGSSPHQTEIANEVRKVAPENLQKFIPSTVSTKQEPKIMAQTAPLPVLFDNSQSVNLLGINYKTTEEMVSSSLQSLLDNGFNDSKNSVKS